MAKTSLMKYILLSFMLCNYGLSYAQSASDTAQYDQVRSLVSFYEYMLNNIGSPKTSVRDKDVMIKQSYKKIFLNDQVQIEDDLILDRKVITNKDIASYLKDVDFFFDEISFEFNQVAIDKVAKPDGGFFFLVSFENNVTGITIEKQEHNSIKKRFIEVNLDQNTNDLKIVSIYSTKVSREKELATWWANLSYGWIQVFKTHLGFNTISNATLLEIADMDSLNIANHANIIDIEPLAALRQLKVVDLSNSGVSDISPLRYSRQLQKLNISNTRIKDISTLQYFDKLATLIMSDTEVLDLTPIAFPTELSKLDLSYTKSINFEPLNTLSAIRVLNLGNTSFRNTAYLSSSLVLEDLNISNTQVYRLSGCKALTALKRLDISNTGLTSLYDLQRHPSLEVLNINHTAITSLNDLVDIPNLQKVSADYTNISEQTASGFMKIKPDAVVVTNSEEAMNWWNGLSENWKVALLPIINNAQPHQDNIIKLLNIDSLNLSDKYLNDGMPLAKFKNLKYLDVSKNLFADIDFTRDIEALIYLNIEDSPIKNIAGLENNFQLQSLILNKTNIDNIEPLTGLDKLKIIEANQTLLTDDEVKSYLVSNPSPVIVYQSRKLENWWSSLSRDWKKAFQIEGFDTYKVHKLIEAKEITITGASITSLEPLDAFINLEKIGLDKVGINNIQALAKHQNIKSLSYTNGPLVSLEGIIQFSQLESLDITNTAVEDLRAISTLTTLKHLNCSGTGVKNLKHINRIYGLETLDISNTGVWRIDWLYTMYEFKKLICNNTKLSDQKISDFKAVFPNCEVTYY